MLDTIFLKKESPLVGMMGGGPVGPLGISRGATGPSYPDDTYWISVASKGNYGEEYTESLDWDNDGNIYVSSIRYNAAGQGQKGESITSYAVDGTRNWQKVQYRSGIPMESRVVTAELDDDHIYTAGQSNAGLFISKFNKSDGTVDWRRNIGSSSNSNNYPLAAAMGSDGNPIFIIRWNEGADEQMYISLDESNGSTNWSTLVTKNAGSSNTYVIYSQFPKIDSSGNIHSVVYAVTSSGHPNYISSVVKHNSSGVLQSISDYKTSYPNEDKFNDLAIDGSGNKYIAARYTTSGGRVKTCVLKVNSSDVIQWQTKIESSNNAVYPDQIEITPDKSEVVVKFGDRQSPVQYAMVKLKTSDGTEVWNRKFGVSGLDLYGSYGTMRLNRNGNIVLNTFFQTGGNAFTVVAQLPGDGSLTGNYTASGHPQFSWAANTNVTVTASQTIFAKQGSSIFSSGSVTPSNAAYSSVTLANNVQTFSNVAVS